MTANELKEQVLLLFDKQFEWAAPAYDDRQISKVLTDAQLIVVEDIYSPRKDGEDFESSELSRRRLEQLIKPASLGAEITVSATQTGIHPNGTFYDLPTDFFLAIEEAAVTNEQASEAQVKPIEHNFYTQNISNPYKKPYKKVIWRMDISRVDHGEADGDSFTNRTPKRTELIVADKVNHPVTAYRMRYLATPPDIVCDEFAPANQRHSILDSTLHPKIVREAVKIMTASVKPEEYQIAVNEQRENI